MASAPLVMWLDRASTPRMKGSSTMLKYFLVVLLSAACLHAQSKVSPEREASMKAAPAPPPDR